MGLDLSVVLTAALAELRGGHERILLTRVALMPGRTVAVLQAAIFNSRCSCSPTQASAGLCVEELFKRTDPRVQSFDFRL